MPDYLAYLNQPDSNKINLEELYKYLLKITSNDLSKIARTKYDEIYIFRGDSFKSTCVIRSINNMIFVIHRSNMKHLNRRFKSIEEAKLNNWLDYFWD